MADDLISVLDVPDEMGKRFGITPKVGTVRAWLRTGKIKGIKVGGTVLVDRSSLDDLVKPMGKNGEEEDATIST